MKNYRFTTSELREISDLYWLLSFDRHDRPYFDIPLKEIAAAYGMACGQHVSELMASLDRGGAGLGNCSCSCGGMLRARNRTSFLTGEFSCERCHHAWEWHWGHGRLYDTAPPPVAPVSDDAPLPSEVRGAPEDIQQIVRQVVKLFPVPWTEGDYAVALATAARLGRTQ